MLENLCGFMRGLGVTLLVVSVLALSAQTLVGQSPGPGDDDHWACEPAVACNAGCVLTTGGRCAGPCVNSSSCNACTCQTPIVGPCACR